MPLSTTEQQLTAAAAAATYDQLRLEWPLSYFLVFNDAAHSLFTTTLVIQT